MLYPAGDIQRDKGNPRPLEWLEPERSLAEVIWDLHSLVTTPQARKHLLQLTPRLTDADIGKWEQVPVSKEEL